MKEIINGMVYDTEQAQEIAHFSNGGSKRDFRHISETLYKTDKGNYFIHGLGGAKTKYASQNVNGRSSGESIRVKDKSECIEWAEKRNVDLDSVINEFSDELEQA